MHKIGHISITFTDQCHSVYFPFFVEYPFSQAVPSSSYTHCYLFQTLYYYSTMYHDGTFTTIFGDMCCHIVVNHWQRRVTLGFLIPPAWVTVWSPSKSTHYTAALGGLWMVCLQQHLTAVWLWCHFPKYNHRVHVCGSDHGFFSPRF